MMPFDNPLNEDIQTSKIPESCIMVIFGATGDLTARKLIPALYNLERDGQLPAHFVCIGFARRPKTTEQFREEMLTAVSEYSRSKPIDANLWKTFSERLHYHQGNFNESSSYERLKQLMTKFDNEVGTQGNRLYYLSVQPSDFITVVDHLSAQALIYPVSIKNKWSRIIIEKPFGRDTDSAVKLQQDLTQHLDESQIFRIDHYLGKETVQNLLIFRFANPIFESVWNNRHIDNVQITVAEEIGIGTRGHFWEEAGMVRDIVQNHVMQLMTLVAMEPPVTLSADDIRDEKVKVLESIEPFSLAKLYDYAIRGQYGPGYINGSPVIGYRQENNVNPNSNIETYAAFQLSIDNWRWSGVPFFVRAGKRLPLRTTEIAITFKKAPGNLFGESSSVIDPNVLIIRIQPDEGISVKFNCKVPALNTVIQPVKMDFRYGSYFGSSPPEAYERLVCDCMAGDSTLFARDDEVYHSWKLFTPVLEVWENTRPENFPNYASGTWGPNAADHMIEKTGRKWRLI